MSAEFSTLWIQQALNEHAIARASQIVQETGRALPCTVTAVSGSLVTVKFECTFTVMQNGQPTQVTLPTLQLPKAESQWLRAPTQVGDVGLTVPADTFLGGISGLGSGTADLGTQYGNMSTLVWVPVAAKSFSPSPDANKAWVNGPNGAILSDQAQTVSVAADHTTGQVTITAGSFSVVFDKATGTLQIGGSGTTANDGICRLSDLQAGMNAVIAALVAWTNAHFASGSNTAAAPTNPTATASTKSFTA